MIPVFDADNEDAERAAEAFIGTITYWRELFGWLADMWDDNRTDIVSDDMGITELRAAYERSTRFLIDSDNYWHDLRDAS